MKPRLPETIVVTVELLSAAEQLAGKHGELEIEVRVRQYAAGLVRDLNIPATIEVLVKRVRAERPECFRVLVNGEPCRTRWWPRILDAALPLRQFACVISAALYECRESLVTEGVADLIARNWEVRDESGYRHGWSARGFHEFLLLFVRRNIGLERAQPWVTACRAGSPTKEESSLCFEEAVEELCFRDPPLQLRVSVGYGKQENDEPALLKKAAYDEALTSWRRFIADRVGLVFSDASVAELDLTLAPDEFCCRLNDVRLPSMRCNLPRERVFFRSRNDLENAEDATIVEPLSAVWFRVAKDPQQSGALDKGGDQAWAGLTPEEFIARCVALAIRLNAGSFVSAPMCQVLLDREHRTCSGLIDLAARRLVANARGSGRLGVLRWTVSAVMRNLLDELVPVRNLRGMLESFLLVREVRSLDGLSRLVFSRTPSDNIVLAADERVCETTIAALSMSARIATRSLFVEYASVDDGGRLALKALLLHPELEMRLLQHRTRPLGDAEVRLFREAVFASVAEHWSQLVIESPFGDRVVLLVSQVARPYVRELLRAEFPVVSFLGSNEVLRGTGSIEPVVVSWPSRDSGRRSEVATEESAPRR